MSLEKYTKLWEMKLHEFGIVNSFAITCCTSNNQKQEVREFLQLLYEYIRKRIFADELIVLLDNIAKTYNLDIKDGLEE